MDGDFASLAIGAPTMEEYDRMKTGRLGIEILDRIIYYFWEIRFGLSDIRTEIEISEIRLKDIKKMWN